MMFDTRYFRVNWNVVCVCVREWTQNDHCQTKMTERKTTCRWIAWAIIHCMAECCFRFYLLLLCCRQNFPSFLILYYIYLDCIMLLCVCCVILYSFMLLFVRFNWRNMRIAPCLFIRMTALATEIDFVHLAVCAFKVRSRAPSLILWRTCNSVKLLNYITTSWFVCLCMLYPYRNALHICRLL